MERAVVLEQYSEELMLGVWWTRPSAGLCTRLLLLRITCRWGNKTLQVNLSKVLSAWECQRRDLNPGMAYSFRPVIGPGLLRSLASRSPQAAVSLIKRLSAP